MIFLKLLVYALVSTHVTMGIYPATQQNEIENFCLTVMI